MTDHQARSVSLRPEGRVLLVRPSIISDIVDAITCPACSHLRLVQTGCKLQKSAVMKKSSGFRAYSICSCRAVVMPLSRIWMWKSFGLIKFNIAQKADLLSNSAPLDWLRRQVACLRYVVRANSLCFPRQRKHVCHCRAFRFSSCRDRLFFARHRKRTWKAKPWRQELRPTSCVH